MINRVSFRSLPSIESGISTEPAKSFSREAESNPPSESYASNTPLKGLAKYDAIMICGYGGPRRNEDVLPFMRNATNGRGIPDSRLEEVGQHYQKFGGISPINGHLGKLRRALETELRNRGVDTEVVVGNRNWTPYFYDVLCDLAMQGKTRILCVFAAAYVCYSCCRQYREDLAKATTELSKLGIEVELDKIRAFANTAGFITANAEILAQSVRSFFLDTSVKKHVCFVTHSIPTGMEICSSTNDGGPSYEQQHREVCTEVIAKTEEILKEEGINEPLEWDLSFCSRSGPPQMPWLEPDINDRLAELSNQGVKRVLTSPIGFICDHMEVVFDLDTEAYETATGLQLDYFRSPTVGVHQKFISALADLVLERDGQLKLSDSTWGKPVLPYVWPAWPMAADHKAHPNSPELAALMQYE